MKFYGWKCSHDPTGELVYRFGYIYSDSINYLSDYTSNKEWTGVLPGHSTLNTTIIIQARNIIGSVNMSTLQINITNPQFVSISEEKEYIYTYIQQQGGLGIFDKLRSLGKIAHLMDTTSQEYKLVLDGENVCGGCGANGSCVISTGRCLCNSGWALHPRCILDDETAHAQINNTLTMTQGPQYIYNIDYIYIIYII